MEALYGRDRAAMLQLIGRRNLLEEFERLADKPQDTILYIDLKGRDPDDAATSVPYEKGAAFLHMLEHELGRSRLDAFLRAYFDRHAFQSMTTHAFLEELRAGLLNGDKALEEKLRVREWLFEPGLPANAPQPFSDAFTRVEAAVKAFLDGTPPTSLETKPWSTQEWQHFLSSLPHGLSASQLTTLDRAFDLTEAGNSEILFAWLRVAIRHHYQPAMPALERFLTSQGRRKFVKALFEELLKTDWGRPFAERIFAKARPLYHSVTAGAVEDLLEGKK
jgi:hypothetical protein